MHGIGYADRASTSEAKCTNCFVQNSIVTNPAVHVDNTAAKKKNVSRPDRIPSCHHCGIKGHIRPHCNKLRKSPHQKQWKKQKEESPIKNTKVVWVKKEDLPSVLVNTLLKYLNMQVCVPKLVHP